MPTDDLANDIRSGRENEKFVDSLRGFFRGLLGVSKETKTTEFSAFQDRGAAYLQSVFSTLLRETLREASTRVEKYDKFRYLDDNLVEAKASLNVYADNIVSGTVGGEENYVVAIDEKAPNQEKLDKIVSEVEKRTEIKDIIWDISRDLTQNGDVFEEVVIAKTAGKMYIDKLKVLPEREMFVDIDEFGRLRNTELPYYQKPEGYTAQIPFEDWRVIHFKIGRRTYGVDRSIFAGAAQRIGRQLLWIDESLVLARLSRAWMRYAFLIDTKNLSPEQSFEYVDKFMDRVKRREIIDRITGKIGITDNMLLPDEDIGLPVSSDSKTAVTTLSGDTNLGNIYDVNYLQTKFLMAMTMPKAYVSLEEGIGARATLAQIDIQFARQVRRRQQALVPGLKKFYRLAFFLAGVDPDSFDWSIDFPDLATSDEMVKWNIEQMKALIARTYLLEMGVVNTEYVLREVLEFDDDWIKKYGVIAPKKPAGIPGLEGGAEIPPATAELIRKDPTVRTMLEDLRDIINWKVKREERLAGKKIVGVKREEDLRSKHINR